MFKSVSCACQSRCVLYLSMRWWSLKIANTVSPNCWRAAASCWMGFRYSNKDWDEKRTYGHRFRNKTDSVIQQNTEYYIKQPHYKMTVCWIKCSKLMVKHYMSILNILSLHIFISNITFLVIYCCVYKIKFKWKYNLDIFNVD